MSEFLFTELEPKLEQTSLFQEGKTPVKPRPKKNFMQLDAQAQRTADFRRARDEAWQSIPTETKQRVLDGKKSDPVKWQEYEKRIRRMWENGTVLTRDVLIAEFDCEFPPPERTTVPKLNEAFRQRQNRTLSDATGHFLPSATPDIPY